MDMRLLIFKTVAEQKNFSRAAELLHISQPAISLNIQALEEYYGTQLFWRNNRKVSLTPDGQTLYGYAVKLLNLYNAAAAEIQEHNHLPKGTLIVGASQTIGDYVVPGLASAFNSKYPAISLTFPIANTSEIIKKLTNHEIALALVEFEVSQSNIELKPFMDDELVVVAPCHGCLSNKSTISTKEITNYPLLLREEGSGTRHVMEDSLRSLGVTIASFPSHLVLGSNQAIKIAVQSGLGITLLSKTAVAKECEHGMLHCLKIAGKSIRRQFYQATLKDAALDLPARLFVEMLDSQNKRPNNFDCQYEASTTPV